QRRAAGSAEAARGSRRRLEFRDLSLRHRVRLEIEPDEDRNRCAAMPATALAVTPKHPLGSAGSNEPDGAAEAASLDFDAHRLKLRLDGVSHSMLPLARQPPA